MPVPALRLQLFPNCRLAESIAKRQCLAGARFLCKPAIPSNSAKAITCSINTFSKWVQNRNTQCSINDRIPEDFLDRARDPESLCKVMAPFVLGYCVVQDNGKHNITFPFMISISHSLQMARFSLIVTLLCF